MIRHPGCNDKAKQTVNTSNFKHMGRKCWNRGNERTQVLGRVHSRTSVANPTGLALNLESAFSMEVFSITVFRTLNNGDKTPKLGCWRQINLNISKLSSYEKIGWSIRCLHVLHYVIARNYPVLVSVWKLGQMRMHTAVLKPLLYMSDQLPDRKGYFVSTRLAYQWPAMPL